MKVLKSIMLYLKIVLYAKKKLFKPEKKDILIFDSDLSDYLLKYFNREDVHVLDVRYRQKPGQKINLYVILKMILTLKFSSTDYFKYYIGLVEPKIIITMIDNNKTFYKLKKLYPKAKTILVQNAYRTAEKTDILSQTKELKKDPSLFCDFILVFNNYIGELYKEFLRGEVISIGSFRSNFNKKQNKKKKYEILFISIFRNHLPLKEEDFKLLKTINNYFSKNDKKLYVLGNMILNSDKEKMFYNSVLKDTNHIFIPREVSRPTYDIVDQSEIIITVESTLGYEALARKNKVAYFSIRGKSYPENTAAFGWPAKKNPRGPFWVNSTEYAEFGKLIEYLNNLRLDEYLKIYNENASDLMEHDEDNTKFISLMKDLKIPLNQKL